MKHKEYRTLLNQGFTAQFINVAYRGYSPCFYITMLVSLTPPTQVSQVFKDGSEGGLGIRMESTAELDEAGDPQIGDSHPMQ